MQRDAMVRWLVVLSSSKVGSSRNGKVCVANRKCELKLGISACDFSPFLNMAVVKSVLSLSTKLTM